MLILLKHYLILLRHYLILLKHYLILLKHYLILLRLKPTIHTRTTHIQINYTLYSDN